MSDLDILPWLEPLLSSSLQWREIGTAGGIRATSTLVGQDGHRVEYLNLVTACAAKCGRAFHSSEYGKAAEFLGMPHAIANAMIRAGDNNLPRSHEHSAVLARLVGFLTNGGNLSKD